MVVYKKKVQPEKKRGAQRREDLFEREERKGQGPGLQKKKEKKISPRQGEK